MHRLIALLTGGGISGSMALRLAWAVLSTAVLGLWLARRARECDPNPGGPDRWAARLRIVVVALCVFWSAAWIVIALVRLGYPLELEWNGGTMRDHCERVLAGLPIYV